MAIDFDIQVRNGKVRITVGGGTSNAHGGVGSAKVARQGGSSPLDSDGTGGSSPLDSDGSGGSSPLDSDGTGGGNAGSGECCCGTTVIGPIVVDGSAMHSQSGNGGSSPLDSDGTGGSSPLDSDGTGGGNSRSSGGCCGTTVIGPIVITNCCSGQSGPSSGASAGPISSKAVTINPPPTGTLKGRSVTKQSAASTTAFTMQPQQQSNWCWAAVAVSLNAFLDAPTPALEQSVLATELLASQGTTSPDCTLTPCPTVCNQPEPLDAALTITGNLRKHGALFNQHLTFDCIQSWVSEGLPVAARIVWYTGGAHFVVLDGCKVLASGQQLVHVQDPDLTASNAPGFRDYEELLDDYRNAGYWCDTYLVIA